MYYSFNLSYSFHGHKKNDQYEYTEKGTLNLHDTWSLCLKFLLLPGMLGLYRSYTDTINALFLL